MSYPRHTYQLIDVIDNTIGSKKAYIFLILVHLSHWLHVCVLLRLVVAFRLWCILPGSILSGTIGTSKIEPGKFFKILFLLAVIQFRYFTNPVGITYIFFQDKY